MVVGALSLLVLGAPGGAVTATTPGAGPTTTATTVPTWQTTWTSAMDFYEGTAVDATARDLATVAVAGTAVQLRLSNQWSASPTTFGAVTVGASAGGTALVTGTSVPVTFGGAREVTIGAGQYITSDPVALEVRAGQTLAVSMWVEGSSTVTVHYCCSGAVDSYATPNNAGNQTMDETGTPFTLASTHMRWLSAISVAGTPAVGSVVAFGDSITDGFQDAGAGWPVPLQRRIGQLAPSAQVSVVNEGISGNTLTAFPASPPNLTYALTSGGLPGVTRLASDALSLPGTKDVALFLGTNDIWFGGQLAPGSPYGSSASIISAMQSVITQVHAAGMKVFGVTLLPRTSSPPGAKPEVWTPADQANLEAVNAWIRSSASGFDGVIDLAAVTADVYNGQRDSTSLFGPYNSGDNLHPSVAGEVAMANAIPTTLFDIPEAPQLPTTVTATPTPGCAGALAAERVMQLAQSQPTASTTTSTPTTSGLPTTHPVASAHAATSPWLPTVVIVAVVVAVAGTMGILLRRRSLRRRRQRRLLSPSADGRPAHQRRPVNR